MFRDEDNSSFLFFQSHHLKWLYKFYFHCVFVIYLILFYVNDYVGLTKKETLFLYDFYVMRSLIRLSIVAKESQQSASRGRVLAFLWDRSVNFRRRTIIKRKKKELRYWQTRTHCCGHIVADTNVSRLPARATFVVDTNFASETQKCSWFCSETFSVGHKCFPVCAAQETS